MKNPNRKTSATPCSQVLETSRSRFPSCCAAGKPSAPFPPFRNATAGCVTYAHLGRGSTAPPPAILDAVKRDESLRRLSRDHHRALETALKLKRAGNEDAEEAARAFAEFWRDHGAAHFRIEEEVLLPDFARYADPRDERVARVLTDHVEIRRRADDLEAADPAVEDLNELGRLLDEHVRHEERVLFPWVEEAMPADALAALADRIGEAERPD